ncbi:hypothetical protein Fmac_030851 [Flemingia macrophylla]|uniref:Uncharacterized protein n=1 Tax=Flemingia macrophylla TaxID=520843 RepID=A0ABD1L0D5_9FABA
MSEFVLFGTSEDTIVTIVTIVASILDDFLSVPFWLHHCNFVSVQFRNQQKDLRHIHEGETFLKCKLNGTFRHVPRSRQPNGDVNEFIGRAQCRAHSSELAWSASSWELSTGVRCRQWVEHTQVSWSGRPPLGSIRQVCVIGSQPNRMPNTLN